MMQANDPRNRGQALVEFALILVVLLFFIFVIIESGRLLQGWLTVQNAARDAARYAITGQYDPTCLSEWPPCDIPGPRVRSIENVGRDAATGLVIDSTAEVGTERAFVVEVWGQDAEGQWYADYAGAPGKGVRVRATYWMPVITPMLRPIAQFVRLRGQVVSVNEEFGQVSGSTGGTPGTVGDPNPNDPPSADVSITKRATGPNIYHQPGDDPEYYTFTEDPFTYALVVANSGPFVAEDVTVEDVLPPGVTYVGSSVSGGGSCTLNAGNNRVNCLLPNLPQLGVATVDIEVIAPDEAGIIVNTATVATGPDTYDPDQSDNTASFELEVKAKVDLSVDKSDSPDPVHTDEQLVYTIVVSNDGPGDALNVVLTDTLPAEIGTNVVPTASQGSCPTITQTRVICNLDTIPNNGTATVTIVVEPNVQGVLLTNHVVVGTDSYNTNQDNEDEETTLVYPAADLSLQKSGPESVLLGQQITYSIVIQNAGPDPATGVVLEDDWFPDIVTFVSSTADCQPNVGGHDVRCNLPDIPDGGQLTVQITVQTGVGAGSLNNRARVFATEADATDNNEDDAITAIRAADLAVQKTGPDRGTTDQPLTYDIGVSNLGPDLAPAVTLVDTLPAGVTYVSNDGGCSVAGQQVTCNLGDLGPLAAAVVHITVQPTQVGTIVNTASASSAAMPDPVPGNDTDDHSTLVAVNDLALTKTAPAEVTVNQAFNYTISVHNNGSASATQVVVTDALAPSLTFLGASGGTCTVNANNLATCTMADIPSDGTAVLTLNVRAGQAGTIVNTAVVDAFEQDPNPSNNSDSATTEVTAADISTAKSAPACVVRNTQFQFTITISNLGPSAAGNIVVTDVLDNVPAGIVTFISAAASNGGTCTYNSGNRTVTCSNISLSSGGVATVTITVLAGAEPPGQGNDIIVNQAHAATASVFDPNPNNNTSLPVYVDVLANCN